MTAILFWISSMSVATENQPLDYIPCSKRTIKHKQPLNRTASVNRQDSSIELSSKTGFRIEAK